MSLVYEGPFIMFRLFLISNGDPLKVLLLRVCLSDVEGKLKLEEKPHKIRKTSHKIIYTSNKEHVK